MKPEPAGTSEMVGADPEVEGWLGKVEEMAGGEEVWGGEEGADGLGDRREGRVVGPRNAGQAEQRDVVWKGRDEGAGWRWRRWLLLRRRAGAVAGDDPPPLHFGFGWRKKRALWRRKLQGKKIMILQLLKLHESHFRVKKDFLWEKSFGIWFLAM